MLEAVAQVELEAWSCYKIRDVGASGEYLYELECLCASRRDGDRDEMVSELVGGCWRWSCGGGRTSICFSCQLSFAIGPL